MLLWSPDKSSKPWSDLPLDTPEQVSRSREVDAAREHHATARRMEGEAIAVELENDHARFDLTKKKIYLTVGLFLLAVVLVCGASLWVYGEKTGALYLVGTASSAGGVGAIVRQFNSP
jgi:hypothetical protein